jgi:hypothetical protein
MKHQSSLTLPNFLHVSFQKGDSSAAPASKDGDGSKAEEPSVYIEALKCTLEDVDIFLAEAVSK